MCLTVKKQKQKIFRQRRNSSSTLPSSFEHFRVKSPRQKKKCYKFLPIQEDTLLYLIHGVEDGAFFVNKSSVLYMYHGTVYTVT